MITYSIEVKPQKEWGSKYPYIGIKDELIVLFTEKNTGMVIAIYEDDDLSEDTPPIGYYGKEWTEHLFTPFKQQLILQNK